MWVNIGGGWVMSWGCGWDNLWIINLERGSREDDDCQAAVG